MENQSKSMSIKEILKKYNLLVLLLFFIVVATIASDNFFSVNNFMNILRAYAAPGIIAIGMTFVVLTGGIDLSVGSLAALAGMISGICLSNGTSVFVAVVAGVLCGAVLGTITGVLVTRFELPAFIASLAVMVAGRGLTLLTTNGGVISGLLKLGDDGVIGKAFNYLGNGELLGLPFAGVTWIVLTLVMAYVLKYTLFGRSLYAIGGNKESAFLSGIRINLYNTLVYTISGALAAYAGVMLTAWLTVAQPTLSEGAELDAIAATVLGGTSLAGGTGGVIGTFGGVVLLAIITNLFNLIGLESYYQQIFTGVIIVVALLLNKVVITRDK